MSAFGVDPVLQDTVNKITGKQPVVGVQGRAFQQQTFIVDREVGQRYKIHREPFTDFFVVTLPDGSTEDLEPDQVRMFFYQRGGNLKALEKCMDYAWEFSCLRDVFYDISAADYHEPQVQRGPADPKI